MKNKYAGKCYATGEEVAAGAGAIVKTPMCGGRLLGPTALKACVCTGDERKLASAIEITQLSDDPESELDHEDYALLEAVGLASGGVLSWANNAINSTRTRRIQ